MTQELEDDARMATEDVSAASVVEELERKAVEVEAWLREKEEENAALKRRIESYHIRWLEYEIRAKSLEEAFHEQMAALQMAQNVARMAEETAYDRRGPSESHAETTAAAAEEPPVVRLWHGRDRLSSSVGSRRSTVVSRVGSEFRRQSRTLERAIEPPLGPAPPAAPISVDDLKKLKAQFRAWAKDYKARLRRAQSEIDRHKRLCAVMVVAAPEVAARLSPAAVGLPLLLLTSRSAEDPAALSAEELIDGADPAAEVAAVSDADVAFLVYPSAATAAAAVTMTHADLVAAMARVANGGGRRVCLASFPMCSARGLPLLALGLPAAGVTTVLLPPPSSQYDPRAAAREAVAAHTATDFLVTPEEAAAALAAPVPLDGKLSSLRRVIVAPTPLTPGAREEFRRRLPWVQLLSGTPENQTKLLLSLPPTRVGRDTVRMVSFLFFSFFTTSIIATDVITAL